MKKIANKILKYFIEGLLIIVPFALTAYLIFAIINGLHRFVQFAIQHIPFIPPGAISPVLGVGFTLFAVFFLGYIGTNFIVRSLINLLEWLVMNIPLVNVLYSYIKESTSGFKDTFNNPVLVVINEALKIEKIGFITQQDLAILGVKEKIAVYIPHSFSFSGELNIVPKEHVKPLNLPHMQVLRFIFFGGSANISTDFELEGGK